MQFLEESLPDSAVLFDTVWPVVTTANALCVFNISTEPGKAYLRSIGIEKLLIAEILGFPESLK